MLFDDNLGHCLGSGNGGRIISIAVVFFGDKQQKVGRRGSENVDCCVADCWRQKGVVKILLVFFPLLLMVHSPCSLEQPSFYFGEKRGKKQGRTCERYDIGNF